LPSGRPETAGKHLNFTVNLSNYAGLPHASVIADPGWNVLLALPFSRDRYPGAEFYEAIANELGKIRK
jgi:hypothetical protein